ncbi:ATP-binding cassette domain-containing protein [Pseudonocardia sp. KRD291]|uniref:ATP-binding cassette domain-containing protein n=1 Tax=Pseudonocardia sp. KRD291 TaxID=2792007 RepID=UPI001C4A0709|nr:ATP-binding cassette domain-containing protein [Pseudonocardia sp. KRD291]MBW0102204.1 ABC transporter ATP-binding protein [Pseudonocardia sp. KRD291]
MRLVDVGKSYRPGAPVLTGIDLQLEPGVPFVLHGANGSGKSTLLRIAAGCETPTTGRVESRPDVVGYLPDRFPALLRLPARRYLRHLAAIRRVPAEDAARTGEAVLTELGFSGEDGEPMAALSKGNAQKVGLAQALSCGADLLVLDEPWSGLDDAAVAALDERLAALRVRLLLTDHTGTAETLPGAQVRRLGPGGRLEPGPEPAAERERVRVRVEVVFRSDPRELLDRLPLARVEEMAPGRLVVRLPPRHSDAWLAAALAAGCSVRDVVREQV